MWLHPVGVKENVQTYISPKLCLTPEIKSKYFRTGECVGIGQITVVSSENMTSKGRRTYVDVTLRRYFNVMYLLSNV